MKTTKLAISLIAVPLTLGSVAVQAESFTLPTDTGFSAPAAEQLRDKQHHLIEGIADRAKDAWVELGEPWIEWQQESSKNHLDKIRTPVDVIDKFEKFGR